MLDARIAEIAARLIGDLRPAISGYVTDVIAGWEPQELTARFEAEIGPDLQYIRINGAVLGSLIGGAIFGLNALLGLNSPAEPNSEENPMKITVNVDCTPEEARAFLGPAGPEADAGQLMQEMQEANAGKHAGHADPQELLQRLAAGQLTGFEQLQAMFAQMGGAKRE